MSDAISNIGLEFACVAAHWAATQIAVVTPDETSALANAAQCYGIVRVSGRMLRAGTWDDDAHQPIYGAAYRAVNEALMARFNPPPSTPR